MLSQFAPKGTRICRWVGFKVKPRWIQTQIPIKDTAMVSNRKKKIRWVGFHAELRWIRIEISFKYLAMDLNEK